ncbi:MAG: hypothetical protein DRH90_24640 [Deltaproteobacteria bacterium]|nr:MAG: hypothetical protein DRH90_24640 [Deltaproteobacteria bacterium]
MKTMKIMREINLTDFNLIVSTGRDFESQAQNELWFNLLAIGDENPIIFNATGIQGLILAKTKLAPRALIQYMRSCLLTKDPEYCQFVQKVYPIDIVVPTELDRIQATAKELIASHPACQDPASTYRISIRKRTTSLKTQDIIAAIADTVPHKVSLKNFTWNLQIEIVGKDTGLAILEAGDIFQPLSEKLGSTASTAN